MSDVILYGYVYKTRNEITKEVYIGQKRSNKFIPTYLGSSPYIMRDIKEYGKDSFSVKLLDWAKDQHDLDELEIKYIRKYKKLLGDRCINRAMGGLNGHNTSYYTTEEQLQAARDRMIQRYRDPEERKRHALKVKKTWSDPVLRKEQSERSKKMWETRPRENKLFYKKCVMKLNGDTKIFDSVKDLRAYLISEYDYNPDRRTFKKIMLSDEPYHPYHKNNEKLMRMDGMELYYIQSIENIEKMHQSK